MNKLTFNTIYKPETASNYDGFESIGYTVTNVLDSFPTFTGIKIMMMPFYAQDLDSLPYYLDSYKPMLKHMIEKAPEHVEFPTNSTAYLTIDEKVLAPNVIQRKPGLHVDGMYKGTLSGAWGGGGGGWGSVGNGMLLVSNTTGLCDIWTGSFKGVPINDGDCEHLREQLHSMRQHTLKAGEVIWADGLCVHESYPTKKEVKRQFVRISMPNNAPWFEGYTENPLGIKPSGCIINERRISKQAKPVV